MELAAELEALNAYLERSCKSTFRALKPGAADADLTSLSREIYGGNPLPADLETWLRWHDGQKGSSAELIPEYSFTMLGAKGAAKAWKAMRKLKSEGAVHEPWQPEWVPLFDNGGGDYLVYDSASGRLLEYWHDEDYREVVAESLCELTVLIRERVEEQKVAARPRSIRWSLDRSEPLTSVSVEVIRTAPVGTTFYGGPARLLPELPAVPPQYLVVVKSHPRHWWAIARSKDSLEVCFAEIRSRLEAGGDPLRWGGYDGNAAQSWTKNLLADAEGRAPARVTVADISVKGS